MRPSFRSRIVVAVVLAIMAPLASASIHLPLPWKEGMRVNYLGKSVQEDQRAGKTRRIETRETNVLRITQAGPEGFVQTWRTSDSKVTVGGDAAGLDNDRKLALALARRFEKLSMEAVLDPQGNFTGLRNWKALGAAMREVMLPALLAQNRDKAQAAGVDEAALRERLKPVLAKMTDERALSSTLGRQAAVFNFFTGARLAPGKPVGYTDVVPSPWNADLIPTTGSFELREVGPTRVTIAWKQSIDSAKAREVMRKIGRELAGKDAEGKPRPAPKLTLTDEATVVMDRRTGLPLRIEQTRRIGAGDSRKTTVWTLEKLPD